MKAPPRGAPLLFGATILLSAFLLFQVQPLLAKLILPWFGGAAAVWTSCLLFFQLTLLAGYAYAHWLSKGAGTRPALIHVSLLALSLPFLPILPSPWWKPAGGEAPLWRLLGLLAATAGLPYFLLSSTSPLLQAWYSRSLGGARAYRFFALSNAGALAGLMTYPVFVEPYLSNRTQAWMWSISYGAFVLVCAVVAWHTRGPRPEPAFEATETAAPPGLRDRLLWMGLAACGSALLLAVTNHLAQNIAAIPFLWVLPLSLYLLSFILCFDSDRWYHRAVFAGLAAGSMPAMAYAISENDNISARAAITLFGATMFVLLMVCHGELARRRPPAAYLTSFYLVVAAGGACGGLFIGLAAPSLFNALYDLPLVLSLTSFLLLYLLWQERGRVRLLHRPLLVAIIALLMAYCELLTERFGPPAILAAGLFALGVVWSSRGEKGAVLYVLAVGLSAGTVAYLAHHTWTSIGQSRLLARNFYGALVVYDQESGGSMGPTRVLRSGTIEHGEQFLWPQNQRYPTAYYARNSGVGRAMEALLTPDAMAVGMIGLGAGTLTTYARPMDHYSIYEIDPNVVKAAQTQFTFLQHCLGPYDVFLGDARLSLEREPSRQFDLLVVDAFSGDAIPVHLLTREAFGLYWRHLKPEGVLAVHVSNRYLSLGPVIAMGAVEYHKRARLAAYPGAEDKREAAAEWVLVTSRPGFFELPDISSVIKPIEVLPGLRLWTDDYSNLYRVLR